jgi:secreted trypsin-like serine protease
MGARRAALAAATLLALVLSGCGGDDPGAPGGTAGAAGTAAPSSATSAPEPSGTTTGSTAAPSTTRGPDRERVRDVADGGFPFTVAILDTKAVDENGEPATTDRGRLVCGGSLIDVLHVLTAAHCAETGEGAEEPIDPVNDFLVVAGRTRLDSGRGQQRHITAVRIHPRYGQQRGSAYDAAVLTLDRPVSGIQPVGLANAGDSGVLQLGRGATVTGWGDTRSYRSGNERAVIRSRMKALTTPLVAADGCARSYQGTESRIDPATMLCTSTAQALGHCLGDSGGPLFVETDGRFVQIGVVSFASGCGDKRYPSVYTRLTNASVAGFIRSAAGSG